MPVASGGRSVAAAARPMATSALPSVRMNSGIRLWVPSRRTMLDHPSCMHEMLATPAGAWGAGQICELLHWRGVHSWLEPVCWQHG